nr:immunoglobulin heavy chain junction region [Mus musculus]
CARFGSSYWYFDVW